VSCPAPRIRVFTVKALQGTVSRRSQCRRSADLDAGEITDKGYVNQRRVLIRRASLVEVVYAEPPVPGVIVAEGTP